MDSESSDIILKEIKVFSRIVKDPVGREVAVIREVDAAKIKKKYDRALREIYITGLREDIWPYRYIRNRDSMTSKEQLKLAESRVAVIGCGGLGGYVLLMLSRIGIGKIVVVDPDVFDESNLNRQVFAITDTLGISKVEAAELAVKSINPATDVKGFHTALTDANAEEVLYSVNVVVDAVDNLPGRRMMKDAACRLKLPLVHGAIAGFEGQVSTIDYEDPGPDALFKGNNNGDNKESSAESFLGVPSITPVIPPA